MNWGWGGSENGWYAFNNFNPGNNTFNYKVKMVCNIKPLSEAGEIKKEGEKRGTKYFIDK